MLRFCRLNTEPGQTFGFELAQEDQKHIIRNVKPESPAGILCLLIKLYLIEFFFHFSPSWST